MKKYINLLILLTFKVIFLHAQSTERNRFKPFANYLFDTQNMEIIHTFDENTSNLSSFFAGKYLYLADSSSVRLYSYPGFNKIMDTQLTARTFNYIKLTGLYDFSSKSITVYAAAGTDTNQITIFKFENDSLCWQTDFPGYSLAAYFPINDTTSYIALMKIDSLSPLYVQITYLKAGMDTLQIDTTFSYSLPNTDPTLKFFDITVSPKYSYIAALTDGTQSFFFLTPFSQTGADSAFAIYGSTFSACFSTQENYFYMANGKEIIRYNLQEQNYDTIQTNYLVRNLALFPNASIITTYAGQDNNLIGQIFNPDGPDSATIYFYPVIDTLPQGADGSFTNSPPEPVFDFIIKKDTTQKTTFHFYCDSALFEYYRREPDKIYWYVNQHLIDSTFYGDNLFTHTFYAMGTNLVQAKAFFTGNDTSVITVSHYLFNPQYLTAQLFVDTLVEFCDTPYYEVNFSRYALNADSIVWYLNREKQAALYGKAKTILTQPGDYLTFIYLADTILSDTLKIRYLRKDFSEQDIKILINDEQYQPGENIYCTNDGILNFRLETPESQCNPVYQLTWDYGDNTSVTTFNKFTAHRYDKPGTYTVSILMINTETRGSFILRFPVTVSINPINYAPAFLNLNRLDPLRLELGKDVTLFNYKWHENNIFYATADTTVYDSLLLTVDINDSLYWQKYSDIRFFADLATDRADNLQITLENDQNVSLEILPFYHQATKNIFFGLPKIYEPNLTDWVCDESFYTYTWDDDYGLNFRNLLALTVDQTDLYDIFDWYLQDNSLLYLPHYWLAPCGFEPGQPLTSLGQYPLGKRFKIKFKIDTSYYHNHLSVKNAGIIVQPSFSTSSYQTWWQTNAQVIQQSDSNIVLGSSEAGKYLLEFYVTDKAGCTYKSGIDLYVLDTVAALLPNAFTPNGDGYNDYWDLRRAFFNQLTAVPQIPVYVKIWNQYGKVVKNLIVNEEPMWDGRDDNGNKLPPGIYWYRITVANHQTYKGSVTIIY